MEPYANKESNRKFNLQISSNQLSRTFLDKDLEESNDVSGWRIAVSGYSFVVVMQEVNMNTCNE